MAIFNRIFTFLKRKLNLKKNQIPKTESNSTSENDFSGNIVLFPDVSRYRIVDFKTFKGGILSFKATEGRSYIDPTFKFNVNACLANNISYFAYHFYKCDVNPVVQANNFYNTLRDSAALSSSMLHVVDFETSKYQDANDLQESVYDLVEFCKRYFELTGLKLRVYTGDYLMGKIKWPLELLKYTENPWVANYSKMPANKGIWEKIWAWQFTDKQTVNGIDKPCDYNRLFIDN